MVMQSLRTGASGGIGKFILFGILGMAVAGLAISDFRGTFSGGVGSSDVAKVEDETISIQNFDRTVQRSLAQYQQYNITRQQAYKLGIIDQILTGEIQKSFMVNEAKEMGIEIGREQLKKRLADLIAPQIGKGETPQEALDNILRAQGFTETQFIEQVKREMSVEVLSGAVRDGFVPNTKKIAEDLFLFQNQSRDIELVIFSNEEIAISEEPKEEQLRNLYEGVKHAQYKIPEKRSVRVALLNPEDIEINTNVSEQELQSFYEDNKRNFLVGEQLVITQILVQDDAQAQTIFENVQSGKELKEAGTEVLGDDLKYIEKVPFETVAMLPVMRDALAGREFNVVQPPVKSPLGIHIMKLDKVIPATIRPFEIVKDQIEKDLTIEKKAEQAYEVVIGFEERLNDGETFEDVQKDIPIKIEILENVDRLATNWQQTSIAENDKPNAIEAIFAIEQDQKYSVLEELPSGMFAIFELQSKKVQSFEKFETVKEDLKKQFIADQQAAENKLRVNKYIAEIETGGNTLKSLSEEHKKEMTVVQNITLSSPIAPPLNEEARPKIFQADLNEHMVLNLTNGYGIARIASFKLPELSMAEEGQIDKINEELVREAEDEALLMFVRHLGEKYEAQINKRLIEQVYNSSVE